VSAPESDITNILGCRIYLDGRLVEGGISVAEGKVIKLGKESSLPSSVKTVKATGLIALPGLIDIHVHLRDLQQSYKEDYYSGTCAAAAGGFTTVIDMPNTSPVTDSAERLREKMDLAKQKIIVNVGFNIVPASLDEVSKSKTLAMGCKINLVKQWSSLPTDDDSLRSLIDRAAATGKMVIFHAEDDKTVSELESKLKVGKSFKCYYKAHPTEAEDAAVARVLDCATNPDARIHFCHVSSVKSLRLIRKARREGRHVTCEITPHHMLLSEESSSKLGGVSIMDPPLRSRETARRLFSAVRRGVADVVASDHAPHSMEEKLRADWWEVPPGIPGLETTTPLLLTEFARGRISLRRIVEVLAESPARIFGIDRGRIGIGAVADIILVDLRRRFKIDSSTFFSKAKYSPFDGREVTGKVVKTFVRGELVYDEGRIVGEPGTGSIICPELAY
jgi:dihydroorotase